MSKETKISKVKVKSLVCSRCKKERPIYAKGLCSPCAQYTYVHKDPKRYARALKASKAWREKTGYYKKYYEKNRKKYLRYYKRHREEIVEWNRKYHKANKEARNISNRRRYREKRIALKIAGKQMEQYE